jgi:hypothetical protein
MAVEELDLLEAVMQQQEQLILVVEVVEQEMLQMGVVF